MSEAAVQRPPSGIRQRAWILHPLLWGVYPALSLWAANPGQVHGYETFRSLLFGLGLAAVLLILLRILLRDGMLAGIATTLSLGLLLSYGQVYEQIRHVELAGVTLGRHRFLMASWALLAFAMITWAVRKPSVRRAMSDLFWVAGGVALLLPLSRLGAFALQAGSVSSPPVSPVTAAAPLAGASSPTLPDIYLVVLDMYTRQDVLREVMGYDNSPFVNGLRALGFQVQDCARSNYNSTIFSFSSFLNMDYAQNFGRALIDAGAPPTAFAGYLQRNRVVEELRSRGYRILAYDSGFSPTELTSADEHRSPGHSLRGLLTGGLNPFEVVYLRSTLGMFLFQGESADLPIWWRLNLYDSAYIAHRERMLFALDDLDSVGREPGPKFVFAHILAPHPPFVFDAQGDFVYRRTPFTLNNDEELLDWGTFVAGYTGEVSYLNHRAEALARAILQQSGHDSVIIFMGDHGLTRGVDDGLRFANFLAVHLPESKPVSLPWNLTLVNLFRLILGEYVGGSYPLLPNHSWLPGPEGDIYSMTEVPESAPACMQETRAGLANGLRGGAPAHAPGAGTRRRGG